MKTVFIIRHAKSSWPLGVADFDRPLNDRGKNDAPKMAKRLQQQQPSIDVFVSSPAKRAFTTCLLFTHQFAYDEKKILVIPELYHAPVPVFANTIISLPDAKKNAALFSHNPGITDFVNTLSDAIRIDNMPTCSIYAIRSESDTWKDFFSAKKTFLFFDYPKLQG